MEIRDEKNMMLRLDFNHMTYNPNVFALVLKEDCERSYKIFYAKRTRKDATV